MTLTAAQTLELSSLPFHLPAFRDISLPVLREALELGLAQEREAIDAISKNPEPPTFENTIAALDDARAPLARVQSILFTLGGTESNTELREMESWYAGAFAEHQAATSLNPQLAKRVTDLEASDEYQQLTTAQRRYIDTVKSVLTMTGSYLNESDAARFAEILGRLATMSTEFGTVILDANNAAAVHVTDVADLDGLDDQAIASAKAAAEGRGLDGWLLALVNTTIQPVLGELTHRPTRQRVHEASISRGTHAPHTTGDIILETVRLRAERARLLGFANHAEAVLTDRCAPDTKAVEDMLRQLITPGVARITEQAAGLAQKAAADGVTELKPWDWFTYDVADDEPFSSEDFKPYLELHNVLEHGLYHAAQLMYGLTFAPRPDLSTYNDDVFVVEVGDAAGNPVGLIVMDCYARESKRGGAWMSVLVPQSHRHNTLPVVTFNMNVVKPTGDAPTLLEADDLRTAFHEFGHVLHGLLSDVEYASQASPITPTDFVEYPSQVNELWALHPDVLPVYAKHHASGDPMPADMIASFTRQAGVVSAQNTVETAAAAILDWEWHTLSVEDAAAVTSVTDFEQTVFQKWGIPTDVVPPRYFSSYFLHIFQAGYSAGYYSYFWSEVMDADTTQWLLAQPDMAVAGKHFAEEVLRLGNSRDPMVSFEKCFGRSPSFQPLLERRQLV